MSVNLIVNGSTFAYPQTGDTDWGNQATQWAQAVTAGTLPKNGGAFLITGEINFGTVAGLKVLYIVSSIGNNPAGNGVIRLSNSDSITWRSNDTVNEYSLELDSSDILKFNSEQIAFTTSPQSFTKGQSVTFKNLGTVSGAVSIDMFDSNNFELIQNGDITSITINNNEDGEHFVLLIKQSGNSHSINWPSNFVFVGTSSPTVNQLDGKLATLTGVYNLFFNQFICSLASQS